MSADGGKREPVGVSYRILMIEDNPADVHLIREALDEQKVPYEFTPIEDGELASAHLAAIEAGAKARPDIVLLDLNLPKISGDVLLQRIRQNRSMSGTPVLVLTSSDSPRDRALVEQLGATAYLRKPSNLDQFMAIGHQVFQLLRSK